MRSIRLLRTAACLVATALSFACTPGEVVHRQAEVRDSAGIRIVESWDPILTEDRMWTVDPEPVVDIGGDQSAGSPPFELEKTHIPERKPTTFFVVSDDEGNLWVQEYPVFWAGGWGVNWEDGRGADPVPWTVFDPDGRLLGDVEIPAELRVFGIQNDHLVTLWRDDLNVEHVRLYRINKGGGTVS